MSIFTTHHKTSNYFFQNQVKNKSQKEIQNRMDFKPSPVIHLHHPSSLIPTKKMIYLDFKTMWTNSLTLSPTLKKHLLHKKHSLHKKPFQLKKHLLLKKPFQLKKNLLLKKQQHHFNHLCIHLFLPHLEWLFHHLEWLFHLFHHPKGLFCHQKGLHHPHPKISWKRILHHHHYPCHHHHLLPIQLFPTRDHSTWWKATVQMITWVKSQSKPN